MTDREKEWKRAMAAWNKDAGPIEKTVKAGEDLYFAALFLIEELREKISESA